MRLGALSQLKGLFPDAIPGFSDHSASIYPSLAAIALGANIVEKHFTSDKNWPGPDMPISMGPGELKKLIKGSNIIYQSLGGTKNVLKEEQPTINFAFSCVVAIKDIAAGEEFSMGNIWVKRPGTGEIKAEDFYEVLSKKAKKYIKKDEQLKWNHINE